MRKFKNIPVFIIPIIGLIISLIILISMNKNQKADIEQQFIYDSTLRINSVHRIVESNQNILFSLRNFYYGSNFVDREEFGNFVSSFIENESGIISIGWFPKVEKDKVDEYEYLYEDVSSKSNSIFSLDNSELNFLYPLTFIEPYSDDYQYFGLDLSFFYDTNSVNILDSLSKGSINLLSSSILGETFAVDDSIIMLLPVYYGNRSPDPKNMTLGNIRGFVFSIISIEEIINTSQSYFKNENLSISIINQPKDPQVTQNFFKRGHFI